MLSHFGGSVMRTCLIADSSHLARRVAARVCGRLGFRSMEVSSGDGLKKAFRRFQPDLTIIDQSVCGEDVGALIVSLRYGLGGLRDLNGRDGIILLTGHELTPDMIDDARIAGADDYIRKPIDDATLARKIRMPHPSDRIAVGQSDMASRRNIVESQATRGGNIIRLSDWR